MLTAVLLKLATVEKQSVMREWWLHLDACIHALQQVKQKALALTGRLTTLSRVTLAAAMLSEICIGCRCGLKPAPATVKTDGSARFTANPSTKVVRVASTASSHPRKRHERLADILLLRLLVCALGSGNSCAGGMADRVQSQTLRRK